jgi:hypothetical protein
MSDHPEDGGADILMSIDFGDVGDQPRGELASSPRKLDPLGEYFEPIVQLDRRT